jgi:predicted nucleotidyltransferase
MIEVPLRHTAAEAYVPSERVRSLITSVVPTILDRAGTAGLVALAVVGSAARGEETWCDEQLAGDIDLAAVVRSPGPITRRRFERASHGLGKGIEIGCFPLYSLSRYRTIEFYEAKRSAWVLWGDASVFERVRIAEAQDIPHWEALRLLLNRAMHCLQVRAGEQLAWYAAVKTYLALGEADLVFAGRYVPSYHGRWQQLDAAGQVLGSRELLARVCWASHAKLTGAGAIGRIDCGEYESWLLSGLQSLVSKYLGQDIGLLEGLDVIARQSRHPAHRAAYLARHRLRHIGWRTALTQDPIFAIWRQAIQMLQSQDDADLADIRRLLADWRQTHQPLPR